MIRMLSFAVFLIALVTACGDKSTTQASRARPVTVFKLETTAPSMTGDVVGVAEPFRQEDLGFDVGGRVAFVERLGAEVDGPIANAQGLEVQKGTVIARLDPTSLELALNAAKLSLGSAQAVLDTRKLDAEVAAPAEVEMAKAQYRAAQQEVAAALEDVKERATGAELAQSNLTRARNLLSRGSGTQQDLDNATREAGSAAARQAQSEAVVEAKRQSEQATAAAVSAAQAAAQLKATRVNEAAAEVARLTNEVARAKTNLEYATLRAPFAGRITREIGGQGGIVSPGQPVLTLTMFDPIKVVITTTSRESRRLAPGTQALITPLDTKGVEGLPALEGTVVSRPEVANEATRTFRVEVMVRNLNRLPHDDKGNQIARDLFPVIVKDVRDSKPLYIPNEAIIEKDNKSYVVRIARMGNGERIIPGKKYASTPIEIRLASEHLTIAGWNFTQAADDVPLQKGDLLVLNPDITPSATVVISGFDWVLRPGDLVNVAMASETLPSGHYVPTQCIREVNGRYSVFVVQSDSTVNETTVSVHETWRDRRRVEGLEDGAILVQEGTHFLSQGDTVTVGAVSWNKEAR